MNNASLSILKKKAVISSAWVFLLRMLEKGLGIVRLIVLARLLDPKDFGYLGVALLAVAVFNTFTQTGFQAALIQRKEKIEPYLNTVWTLTVLRGALLGLILFGMAPLIAQFFNSPESDAVIRVFGLITFLQSFTNVGVVFFEKDLEFKKQFVFQISGVFVDFIVSITLAILWKNVWAIVLGIFAGQIIRVIFSFIIHSYRPVFSLDWKIAKKLFVFGKWITTASMLNFLVSQGDDIVVGKMMNVTMLSFYQMAFKMSNLIVTEITHVISKVTFPLYSKIQDNKIKVREVLLRTVRLVFVFSLPINTGMFILAPEIILLVLGEKWLPMLWAFQLFCIIGIVRSITANFGPVFKSLGRPDIQTKVSIMNLSILLLAIVPFISFFGMIGAVYARLLTFATQLYTWPQLFRLLNIKLKDFIRVLFLPGLSALIMLINIYWLKKWLFGTKIIHLLALVGFGAFIYVFSLWVLDRIFNTGLKREVTAVFSTLI